MNPARHWLWLACVCALLALPLSFAARGPGVLPGDAEVARAIQAWTSPALDNLAIGFTVIGRSWPGETVIATAIVVALLVAGARREAVFVAAAALAGAINALTKLIVASPRPTADLVQIIQSADGLGFPSGHAFGATLLYGSIWFVLPTVVSNRVACRFLRAATALVAIGICWSRIRLGAHWPSDVVGGVLWGLVVLSLLMAFYVGGVPKRPRVSAQRSP